ncbi:hypothetical protein K2173_006037 [Erythroxylum novogranatense]|uniref:Electron transporter n=1 Tax=Erythroxylum novogranatense TaxID=1862640 RepID=A0AAV8TC34_9ROSI|nr:hypothetical protein K2173_006037 [Erythroxylum novogranatense]
MLSEVVESRKIMGEKVAPGHKRSKSFPYKKQVEEDGLYSSLEPPCLRKHDMGDLKTSIKTNKKQSPKTSVGRSLRQEILQLEKRLQDQFEVRCALEKALSHRPLSHDITADVSMPKQAAELIKEIAVLELEVVYLEQYLLSLYRQAFDQKTSAASPSHKNETAKSTASTPKGRLLDVPRPGLTLRRGSPHVLSNFGSRDNLKKEFSGIRGQENPLDSSVHRCHSTLSQRSTFSTRNSPPAEFLGRTARVCHSQPLSMIEYSQNASSIISLAEHLGTRVSDHVSESPNKLSEDMVKCMSAIYCKLADPPLTHNGLSSPNSSHSSVTPFSPRDHGDIWSPGFRNSSSFDVRLENPFLVEGLKEFSGPYSTMVEVPWIYRDSQKLGDVEHLLENFRSLICRLEEVSPSKLNHEEKIAFWINVHNALVMHAFLAYGIPQNSVKRVFLLLKVRRTHYALHLQRICHNYSFLFCPWCIQAAYNVGGHTISADTIQSSIFRCRMSRPGQWLRLLLPSRSKFKRGDERQAYAIEHAEPLLHFALCSGSHSDPAVRVYTPKRVFQELEVAKEEYIRATFGVHKDRKILLPKIVESFAKDLGLCQAGIIEMVQKSLPESLRKSTRKCLVGKPRKGIEWIPHNFTFRYLISKELVR